MCRWCADTVAAATVRRRCLDSAYEIALARAISLSGDELEIRVNRLGRPLAQCMAKGRLTVPEHVAESGTTCSGPES